MELLWTLLLLRTLLQAVMMNVRLLAQLGPGLAQLWLAQLWPGLMFELVAKTLDSSLLMPSRWPSLLEPMLHKTCPGY